MPGFVRHAEIAPANLTIRLMHLKPHFRSRPRQHEVRHVQEAPRAARPGPLLGLRQERAVEVGGDTSGEQQLAAEGGWHRRGAVRPAIKPITGFLKCFRTEPADF